MNFCVLDDFFCFVFLNRFLVIHGQPNCGIGATIRIGREMLCPPYAGFLKHNIYRPDTSTDYHVKYACQKLLYLVHMCKSTECNELNTYHIVNVSLLLNPFDNHDIALFIITTLQQFEFQYVCFRKRFFSEEITSK